MEPTLSCDDAGFFFCYRSLITVCIFVCGWNMMYKCWSQFKDAISVSRCPVLLITGVCCGQPISETHTVRAFSAVKLIYVLFIITCARRRSPIISWFFGLCFFLPLCDTSTCWVTPLGELWEAAWKVPKNSHAPV